MADARARHFYSDTSSDYAAAHSYLAASLVVAAWAQTPAPTSACTGTVAQNTTRCPGLVGAFVPSARLSSFFPNATNFDPDAFYNYLSKELCRCGQLIGKKWICSFIRSMYALAEPACTQPASVTTRLSCRSACEATIGSQNDTALCTAKDIETLPVISCSGGAWIIDSNSGQSANCEKNSAGGDKCTRPPFLNRSAPIVLGPRLAQLTPPQRPPTCPTGSGLSSSLSSF